MQEASDHKKTLEKEFALTKGDDLFRRLMELAPNGIMIVDNEGNILLANPAMLKMLDVKKGKSIVGGNIYTVIARNEIEHCTSCLKNTIKHNSGATHIETLFVCENDRVFPVEIDAAYTEWNGGPAAQIIVRDISERRQAEQKLKESEKKYRSLLASAPYAIVSINKKGRIVFANAMTEKIFGYGKDELDGQPVEILVPEPLRKTHFKKRVLYANNPYARPMGKGLELFGRRRDGTLFPVEISLSPMSDEKGEISIISIVRDITDHKKAQKEIHDLAKFPDENTAPVLRVSREGILMYANGASSQLIISWGIQLGKSLPKPYPKTVLDVLKFGLTKKVEIECNDRILDLVFVPVKESDYVNIYGFDITERKQSEKELQMSVKKYRRLFDEDLTGNYISTPDGKLLLCNPSFARIFGFASTEEALKANMASFYLNPEAREEFIALLKKEKKLEQYEMEYCTQDGKPVYVIQNVVGGFNAQGVLVEIKGYLYDITEHKKVEDQYRQAQKMEAIGQLAGGVAHDFNNLLTIINGYSDLLLYDLQNDGPGIKKLEQIKQAGKRAGSLTTQLLAFSRRQVIQPKVLNLNSIISDIEKMLHRLIGEDIQIDTKLHPQLGNIKADPGQLDQVLMNLAINARDAMPKGGTLIIETHNEYLDEDYAKYHLSVAPGNYVIISMSDTGIGMDEETKKRIFEPFYTTKGKGKGTGLGLSTVYGIVKQCGGNIWVYSEVGKGTTFKIYFPRVEEKQQPVSHARPAPVSYSGSETILIVEDDYGVREITRTFLSKYGYNVIESSDVDHAIELVDNYDDRIHLLITDVIMPQMNGRDLSEKIISLRPEIKVLFVSGYTDNAIVHHGILNEGVNFLPKPFSPVQLAQKVREVLDLIP